VETGIKAIDLLFKDTLKKMPKYMEPETKERMFREKVTEN